MSTVAKLTTLGRPTYSGNFYNNLREQLELLHRRVGDLLDMVAQGSNHPNPPPPPPGEPGEFVLGLAGVGQSFAQVLATTGSILQEFSAPTALDSAATKASERI